MSGRRARLVIVDANPRCARVAADLDCDVVYVQRPGADVAGLVTAGVGYYSIDFDAAQFDSFVAEVLAQLEPDAVVSITESGLLPAARATEILGLPGTPLAVTHRLRDKYLMRQRLAEMELHRISVRHAAVSSVEQVHAALAAWGPTSRAVLKPRTGAGSRGVELIDGRSAIAWADRGEDWLVEEYVEGRDLSVETFSLKGKHRTLAITEKLLGKSFVSIGQVVPPIDLDKPSHDTIIDTVNTFLDAMELRDGPAHTEIKLLAGSVTVIESHNRIGGSGISELVRMVTGAPLLRWSLEWPLHEQYQPVSEAPSWPAAASAFSIVEPGTVRSITTSPLLATAEGISDLQIFITEGDEVGKLASSVDRVARVIAVASDPAGALARAQWAVGHIHITTEPEPASV